MKWRWRWDRRKKSNFTILMHVVDTFHFIAYTQSVAWPSPFFFLLFVTRWSLADTMSRINSSVSSVYAPHRTNEFLDGQKSSYNHCFDTFRWPIRGISATNICMHRRYVRLTEWVSDRFIAFCLFTSYVARMYPLLLLLPLAIPPIFRFFFLFSNRNDKITWNTHNIVRVWDSRSLNT